MKPVYAATLLGFAAALVEAVGLTAMRSQLSYGIVISSLLYALGVAPILAYSLQYEGIGMVNFLWNVFSTLCMFAIGIYVFKEKVHNLQLIGVGVSLVGLGLILMAPESRTT